MFKNSKKTIILLSLSFILFLIILFKNNSFVINRLESSVNTMSYTEISKKALDSTYYFNNMNYSSSYDMSDPFFLKEGSSYYIYSTSCSGIKISKSTNFQKWNFVTKTALDLNNSELDMSNYVCYWAPEVYKYNNKYYMFFTSVDKNNNHRILVAHSLKPEGPFTNAKDVGSKIKNVIDATVFFDTDGRKYMISKNEDNGNIYIEELNNDLLSIKSKSEKLILKLDDGLNKNDLKNYWEIKLLEGPFVIKRNNTYYLMYSTGRFNDYSYTIGYATSNSIYSEFTKKTVSGLGSENVPLLHGSFPVGDTYDSDKNIYGPGHNSIFKVSENEMYIVYHSAVYTDNSFFRRKINFDYIGFDKNGNLFVNGPSKNNQPIPSGVTELNKVNNQLYTVKSNNSVVNTLNDNINYNVNNTALSLGKNSVVKSTVTNTNQIIINTNSLFLGTLWLFSNNNGFNNTSANMILNDKYIVKNISLGNDISAGIAIPEINEKINKIVIKFSSNVNLTEVSLYDKKINSISIKYDVNGGTLKEQVTSNNERISKKGSIITINGNEVGPGMKLSYGESLPLSGLTNYNNPNYVYITKSGYGVISGEEWVDKNGKVYNQDTIYKASDFSGVCDVSKTSCDVILYVNWKKIVNVPMCTSKKYNGKSQILFSSNSNSDYTNSELRGTNVGTYKTTLKLSKGNIWKDKTIGDKTVVCNITSYEIKDAAISDIKDMLYTGKEIKPSPVIKALGNTLVLNTDYILSYKNNINVGTASIIIKAKGNYSGNRIVTFKIKNKLDNIIDTKDSSFIDIINYEILVTPKKKSKTVTRSAFVNGLVINGTYKIYNKDNVEIKKSTDLITTSSKIKVGSITYTIAINGDVNKDGKITMSDLYDAYRFYKKKALLDKIAKKAADYNNDGSINMSDIYDIYRKIKGKI